MGTKKRPPGLTLERIMKTAQRHFSERGFAGTRVDEIAKDAKVNKAMIYYHFRNKQDLYRAVFISLAPFNFANIDHILSEPVSPEEKLRNFISRMFDIFEENPEFIRLVQWELAAGLHFMPVFVQDFAFPIVQRIWKVLEEGIAAEVFRQIDPFLVYFHVLGLVSEYFFFRPVREELARRKKNLKLAEKFEPCYFKRHLIDFVFEGILKEKETVAGRRERL